MGKDVFVGCCSRQTKWEWPVEVQESTLKLLFPKERQTLSNMFVRFISSHYPFSKIRGHLFNIEHFIFGLGDHVSKGIIAKTAPVFKKISKLHPNLIIIIKNAPEVIIKCRKCPRTMQKLPKLPRFLFFAPIKNKTEDYYGFSY